VKREGDAALDMRSTSHLCPLILALLVLLEVLGACPPHDHRKKAPLVFADVLRRVLHAQDKPIMVK
jgi:hypothetical protein